MIIQSTKVWIGGQFMPAQIEVLDGKIERVYQYGEQKADVDYGNQRILPGFIDIHMHGACGYDFMDASVDEIKTLSQTEKIIYEVNCYVTGIEQLNKMLLAINKNTFVEKVERTMR